MPIMMPGAFRRVFPVMVIGWVVMGWLAGHPAHAVEPTVRVGLFSGLKEVKVLFPGGGWMTETSGRKLAEYKPAARFHWQAGGGAASAPAKSGKKMAAASRRAKSASDRLLGKTREFRSRQGFVEINGQKFRGVLRIVFARSGATVINVVGLEAYVKGVVGREIGSQAPAESQKAQSVIVRTYAIANGGKHKKDGFDVCAREHCQVYGGMAAERPTINAAVDAVRGIVMISDGTPITTLYHATCGGMTSDNENVFGGKPVSYLRRVRCVFCAKGTNFRWTRKIPHDVLMRRLAQEKIAVSRIRSIEITAPSPMDRVDQFIVHSDQGTHRLKGTTLRRLFELPSTTFVVHPMTTAPAPTVAGMLSPSSRSATNPGRNPNPNPDPGLSPDSPATKSSPSSTATETQLKGGPDQLIVVSRQGVRRIPRPRSGWVIMAWKEMKPPPLLDEGKDRRVPLGKGKEAAGLSELVLYGRGYGHQVGLCQAGAIEMGKRGWSFRQILPFYYSHVALRILKY